MKTKEELIKEAHELLDKLEEMLNSIIKKAEANKRG